MVVGPKQHDNYTEQHCEDPNCICIAEVVIIQGNIETVPLRIRTDVHTYVIL